ncbi:sensor histidine kinase [Ottowia thiooxydans]|uniref:sensor histidine kinase n=1 Tax=Ottowia thiooxydans TaxID=219182 RepID=UPI000420D385|nr:HAMP domain-containing sensor histidine kinase [Ottowia thiooxydans]
MSLADTLVLPSEAQWVEAAEYGMLVEGGRTTQAAALLVIGLLCALLYWYVPVWQLVLWATAALTVSAFRHVFCRHFAKLAETHSIEVQLDFVRRYNWIWPLYGATWISCALLLLERLPPRLEAVCWMLVAGVCGAGVLWMSAHLKTARLFVFAAIVCLAVSIGLHHLFDWHAVHSEGSFWFSGLLLIFLLTLLHVANKQHKVFASRIELSYQNARLIYSLRQQASALQEAIKFKDRFLAGAAHDLKQPVNALGIYAEWLSKEPELSPEISPKILQATTAINTLFDSMFDFVKLDAGQFRIEQQQVNVPRLLSDLEAQFHPMASQRKLKLRIRPSPVATFRSDPAILQRILGNLLANAIRYTRQGGILLAVRREPQALRFEVWDTGIGMRPEELSRIFGEFYKVETAGTEEGFGLGLAIVKRLSDLMGYSVSVRSRQHRGSVFCVRVPLVEADE